MGFDAVDVGSGAVSVVLVTFNSSATVLRAIDSIPSASEVIVVDNGSSESLAELLADRGVRLICLPENIGFGGASNIGAKHATREFLLFLNPDAVLHPGAISGLIESARRHPNGAFNPRLVDEEGKIVNRSPSRFLEVERARGRAKFDEQFDEQFDEVEVNVLSGAALFCRRELFNRIGGFDSEFFLYFEDDDVSFRMIEQGCKLFVQQRAVVTHIGGASSPSSSELERFKSYQWERSHRQLCEKHGFRYPYTKRLLLNVVHGIGALCRGQTTKFDKHIGRLMAIVGKEPEFARTLLQKQHEMFQQQNVDQVQSEKQFFVRRSKSPVRE